MTDVESNNALESCGCFNNNVIFLNLKLISFLTWNLECSLPGLLGGWKLLIVYVYFHRKILHINKIYRQFSAVINMCNPLSTEDD